MCGTSCTNLPVTMRVTAEADAKQSSCVVANLFGSSLWELRHRREVGDIVCRHGWFFVVGFQKNDPRDHPMRLWCVFRK